MEESAQAQQFGSSRVGAFNYFERKRQGRSNGFQVIRHGLCLLFQRCDLFELVKVEIASQAALRFADVCPGQLERERETMQGCCDFAGLILPLLISCRTSASGYVSSLAYNTNKQGKEEQDHPYQTGKQEMLTNPEQDCSQWSACENRGRRCEPCCGYADKDAYDQCTVDKPTLAPEPLTETDPPAWRCRVLRFRPPEHSFLLEVKSFAPRCTREYKTEEASMATAMVKAKMALFPEIIVIPHFDNRPCVLVNQVRHILCV